MTEIIDQSVGGIIISDENIPFSAYQAIYHKLTRKTEVLAKDYDDGYSITSGDVKNLDARIKQLIAQYNLKGVRCQVAHSTKDGYARTYSAMEKFLVSDVAAREPTSAFSYEIDFLIVLPSEIPEAKDISQRYKIQIIYDRAFASPDDIRIPEFIRDMNVISTFKLVLEYSDFAVAQAVEATVSGWVNSLPKKSTPRLVKAIATREAIFRRILDFFLRITPLMMGANYVLSKKMGANEAVSVAMFCLGLSTVGYLISDTIVGGSYKMLRKYGTCPMFIITEGDREEVERINSAIGRARSIIAFLMVAGVAAIMVNLFSTWLYEALFQR